MKPASALLTRVTAANALPRPLEARARLAITESEAAKIGILDRWRAAMDRRQERQAKKITTTTHLNDCLADLLRKAQAEGWSQRQLALKIEIPDRTFRRIRKQQIDASVWLPKLTAALERLNRS
jgi:ribosome-binding protein aMBF1 (putative translation factor)